jgi:hypothetical protein
MPSAIPRLPAALKHGAYSTATLLPGEDAGAFDRLHQSLIAELGPVGVLEEHIVANMARFVWRREHLDILRVTKLVEARIWTLIKDQLMTRIVTGSDSTTDADTRRAAAEAQAREELGDVCDLTQVDATEDRLTSEIETRARLDEMIDKCLKRLLFLRGLKSVSRPAPAAHIAHAATDQAAMTNGQAVHAAE